MNGPEILLDIEVLGLRPGSAIIELGAVSFTRSAGIGETFHRLIKPEELGTADLQTLKWHQEQGTWPRVTNDVGVPLYLALADFNVWSANLQVKTFWSWGASFDFPHMDAAYSALNLPAPWRYSRCQCARTVWNLAFPGLKAASKPHHAAVDARLSALDLLSALDSIGK